MKSPPARTSMLGYGVLWRLLHKCLDAIKCRRDDSLQCRLGVVGIVRRNDHIGEAQQHMICNERLEILGVPDRFLVEDRRFSRVKGSCGRTSRPAPRSLPSANARTIASTSTMLPRAVLFRIALCFMQENSRSEIMEWGPSMASAMSCGALSTRRQRARHSRAEPPEQEGGQEVFSQVAQEVAIRAPRHHYR